VEDAKTHTSISRLDLIKAGGKVAAGVAAAGALGQITGAPTVLASSSKASTTLNYMTGLGGGDGIAMQSLVNQFNKEHSNITVKMSIVQPWPTFYNKLLPQLTSGNAPDVFTTHIQEMSYFQTNNLFANLDDLFGASLSTKDFSALPVKYIQSGGHINGMPLDIHGFAYYLNPTLVQKAGLPLRSPSSNEEFLHFVRKLTVDKNGNDGLSKNFSGSNVKQYGYAIDWDQVCFLNALWSFGGNTISADGKTATLNTPQARDAANLWYDLVFKYHASNKPANYGANGTFPYFQNNALATNTTGNWWRDLFTQHPSVPKACVYMPVFGQKRVAWMSGHVITAPASLGSDKKDAVYTFMRWLSNHGSQWSQRAGHIPARISQQRSSAITNLWPQKVFARELPEIGRIEQPNPNFFAIQDAYRVDANAFMNGTKSVDQALSDMQSKVQRALTSGR